MNCKKCNTETNGDIICSNCNEQYNVDFSYLTSNNLSNNLINQISLKKFYLGLYLMIFIVLLVSFLLDIILPQIDDYLLAFLWVLIQIKYISNLKIYNKNHIFMISWMLALHPFTCFAIFVAPILFAFNIFSDIL